MSFASVLMDTSWPIDRSALSSEHPPTHSEYYPLTTARPSSPTATRQICACSASVDGASEKRLLHVILPHRSHTTSAWTCRLPPLQPQKPVPLVERLSR